MKKTPRPDGEKKTVDGIDFYWSRRLRKWVTIPDRDDPHQPDPPS